MTEPRFLLGVDTGGTYTDAAVIDESTRTVVATAKALTTRGDLAVGIAEAVRAAVARLAGRAGPGAIGLVSVSTTLATNAVVEGHGGPAAVVLVGFDDAMVARTGIARTFPGMPVACVGGGHDHAGREIAPLDEAAVESALARLAGRVEAFAVAARFAVRNASHERRARDLIVARTGCPVTISTELASDLDAPRRALTAALNARLVSRISRLVDAVSRAMTDIGIGAPLTLVKGDGTLALASQVASRPIETVLSGPAASLVGARWLAGLDDFVLADMGGTTTDLALFEHGRARLSAEGADLGGWRTMVRAIDARTVGLGGDSEIAFDTRGGLSLGPARVLPLSLLAARFSGALDLIERDLAHPTVSSQSGRFVLRPLGWSGGSTHAALGAREAEMLERVGEAPVPLSRLATGPAAQRALASLRARGLVQVAGLTPSDAAHVLGLQDTWSREAAEAGVGLAVRMVRMRPPSADEVTRLARDIHDETVRRAAREVLAVVLGPGLSASPLVDAAARGERTVGLAEVRVAPAVPVVAVGGPVRVFYPSVASRLDCTVVYPPHAEVANAVGAATACVARSVSVPVTSEGNGVFRVHCPDRVLTVENADEALRQAEDAARAAAVAEAESMGAAVSTVAVEVMRHDLPGVAGGGGLFDATVVATATGRPVARAADAVRTGGDRTATGA